MKKRLYALLISAVLALGGCAAGGSSGASGSESAKDSSGTSSSDAPEGGEKAVPLSAGDENCMPIIAIQTKSDDKKVLDFVTKPVAKHVSESIASWNKSYRIPPEPYYEACTVTISDTDGSIQLDNADADVKVRGNWTTSYAKKPLRIKFDKKQSVLGLNGGSEMKNWVLLAEYKDGSMLRDKAALQMSRELLGADGLYAADARLVEVTINGEYFGVYLLTEQQQVNKNRVNITEPEENYTGTDIGYFLEYDGYFYNEDELHGFHVDYANNAALTPYDGNDGSGRTIKPFGSGKSDVGFTIKSDIYSSEQHDFIASFVNNVYNIMYHAAYDNKAYVFNDDYSDITETSALTPWEAVEKVIDTDSLADMYIISELTCDADIYWSSFFMYADFGEGGSGKLTFAAPWDFDSAMGNKDRCTNGSGFYAGNIVPDVNGNYETVNPWLTVLMYMGDYQAVIKDKWNKAYDSGVFTRGIEMISTDTDTLADAFERNYDKWDNIKNNSAYVGELSWQAAACTTHKDAAAYLADWLTLRVEFLNGQWHS